MTASTAATQSTIAVQETTIVVDGGYSPSRLTLQRGVPVRLTFDRRDASGCSERLLVPDFGIDVRLPTGERTTVEFTPTTSGTFAFTCGMRMLRGQLIIA